MTAPAAAPAGTVAAFLVECRDAVNGALDALLPAENEPPERLHQAIRHSVFAGGKRLRPALLMATARSLGADEAAARTAGAALEMVHTYSLIHDDLPAMDDDRLRRGRPTCHVVYGEAAAILAGDALLTLAFEVLAGRPEIPAAARGEICRTLAAAAGCRGMIAGQVLDLEAEGRPVGDEELERIHRLKTGALLTASVSCGALLASAPPAERRALEKYGAALGLAFQIVDDLLDAEGATEVLGKTAGKDARAAKATFPAVWGMAESRRRARREVDRARDALAPLGERGALLAGLAEVVAARDR